jgi:hypothetical protein
MPRMNRIINFTATLADTWYKAFDASDYKLNRVREIKFKLRETTSADHMCYAFTASPTDYITTSTGVITARDVQKLYIYIPAEAAQVVEIEIIYK